MATFSVLPLHPILRGYARQPAHGFTLLLCHAIFARMYTRACLLMTAPSSQCLFIFACVDTHACLLMSATSLLCHAIAAHRYTNANAVRLVLNGATVGEKIVPYFSMATFTGVYWDGYTRPYLCIGMVRHGCICVLGWLDTVVFVYWDGQTRSYL